MSIFPKAIRFHRMLLLLLILMLAGTFFALHLHAQAEAQRGAALFQPESSATLPEVRPDMQVTRPEMRQADNTILMENGDILYGPYIQLERGSYVLSVEAELSDAAELRITTSNGEETLARFDLLNRINVYGFALSETTDHIEFVVQNHSSESICIKEIFLIPEDQYRQGGLSAAQGHSFLN